MEKMMRSRALAPTKIPTALDKHENLENGRDQCSRKLRNARHQIYFASASKKAANRQLAFCGYFGGKVEAEHRRYGIKMISAP